MRHPFILLYISVFLISGCGSLQRLTIGGDDVIGTQEIQVALPVEGKLVDPVHGKETWFAYGPIVGVNGMHANGVIQAFFFEDEAFLHTMQLNIEPAKEGSYYEGWLVDGAGVRVSASDMRNRFADARHQLRFDVPRDLRAYQKVVVTLEKDDGNPAAGQEVAEGMLKVTPR